MSETPVMSTINNVIGWLQLRLKERTSWDGLTIIVFSLLGLIASPLDKICRLGGSCLWCVDFMEKRIVQIPIIYRVLHL